MTFCACSQEDYSYQKLLDTYRQVIKTFPSDSLSLHRLYFEWVRERDKQTNLRQIKRLNTLMSNENIIKYQNIEENLMPTLESIVYNNQLTRSNATKFRDLYSDYDHYGSEGLLTKILKDNDNYDLVWKSFEKFVKAAAKDTFFIDILISLDNSIKTNVELAESTHSFVIKAVKNNPEGFILMLSKRSEISKKQLLENVGFDLSTNIVTKEFIDSINIDSY